MIRVAVGSFESPTLDYALIAPMLVVFGAALVGVLVEAFVPRRVRGPVQPALGLGALVASFAVLVWVTAPEAGATAAEATVAMDKTSVFLQGTVLLLSFVAMLLFAERGVDPSGDAFAPSAASIPGSEGERELVAVGARQTEIWFFDHTAAGSTVLAARKSLQAQGAPFPFWFYMAPAHRS